LVGFSDELYAQVSVLVDKIPLETIERYLRIISELPTNLRFSQSKRILCEVAIIKLCKPQGETDYDSVLDRVRYLEDELEGLKLQGVDKAFLSTRFSDVQTAVYDEDIKNSADRQSIAPAGRQDAYSQIERHFLEKALPDDIRQAAKLWPMIISEYKSVSIPGGTYAAKATLGTDSDEKLVLAFTDSSAYAYFAGNDAAVKRLESLREFVSRKINKEIKIQVREIRPETGMRDLLLELQKIINFEIDVE